LCYSRKSQIKTLANISRFTVCIHDICAQTDMDKITNNRFTRAFVDMNSDMKICQLMLTDNDRAYSWQQLGVQNMNKYMQTRPQPPTPPFLTPPKNRTILPDYHRTLQFICGARGHSRRYR